MEEQLMSIADPLLVVGDYYRSLPDLLSFGTLEKWAAIRHEQMDSDTKQPSPEAAQSKSL